MWVSVIKFCLNSYWQFFLCSQKTRGRITTSGTEENIFATTVVKVTHGSRPWQGTSAKSAAKIRNFRVHFVRLRSEEAEFCGSIWSTFTSGLPTARLLIYFNLITVIYLFNKLFEKNAGGFFVFFPIFVKKSAILTKLISFRWF